MMATLRRLMKQTLPEGGKAAPLGGSRGFVHLAAATHSLARRSAGMASDVYRLFAWAIENHVPLRCRYKGMPCEFCPITLGTDDKGEVAHVWLTSGVSSALLPAWRTFRLEHVTGARVREGEWLTGASKGGKEPTFEVDYDANRESPYKPAHSLGELRGVPPPATSKSLSPG